MSDLREALDWAARSPLLLLLVTLGGYQLGCWVRDRTGGHALAQPVVVAVGLVGLTITVLDVSYTDYLADVDLITFWLGPATVALAVPLHRQSHRLRGFVAPLVVTVLAGAVVSVTTVVVLVRVLGGSEVLARTMAPKAATTPVSIALSESLGGLPALTAPLTIAVGILGAVAGPAALTLLRIRDRRARGLAMGCVSHGIGTSRSLHLDAAEGAFAGLAMGLTALATSLVAPVLVHLLL